MKKDTLTMEISSDDNNTGVAILKITGMLDFSGIAALSGVFEQIITEGRNYVIVDLSNVNAVCSAVLGEFMGYRKKYMERGGELVFAGLQGGLRSKLTLLGANKIFSFYQDVHGAINAYKWDYKKQVKSVAVTFPPFLKFVPPVRQLASRLVKQNGYTVKDAFRLETIVDEICNNAVDHGIKDVNSAIVMRMAIDNEKVEISVTNQSDPDKVAVLKGLIKSEGEGNLNTHVGDDDKRGRGLALIRMLSNDMNVNITEHGTSVRITKLREGK